jgi:iron complex transport system substrate-binding protein
MGCQLTAFLIVTPELKFRATRTKQTSSSISNRYKTRFSCSESFSRTRFSHPGRIRAGGSDTKPVPLAVESTPMAHRESTTKMRIVSLAPNVTSILLALGAARELVGVSKWCKQVALVGNRPQVGDCWKMDIREVMRLEPTLLIGSVPFAPATVEAILKQPVAFLAINPRSLAHIENDIRTLARLVQRATAGEKLTRKMRTEFQTIARKAKRFRTRPRVYCEAWPHPRISSPPWVAELVTLAGGEIVVPPGASVTDEDVARARPDVIILAWTATGARSKPSSALRNPAWQDVPAIKAGRVVVIRDELLNTPGPPLIEGARQLLHALHPDSVGRKHSTGTCEKRR